ADFIAWRHLAGRHNDGPLPFSNGGIVAELHGSGRFGVRFRPLLLTHDFVKRVNGGYLGRIRLLFTWLQFQPRFDGPKTNRLTGLGLRLSAEPRPVHERAVTGV